MVEKDFAYHRDLAQQRNRNLLEALHAFDGSNQLLEQQITHAHSKKIKTNTADALCGMQIDSDKCHRQPHQSPHPHGRQHAEPHIISLQRDIKRDK